MNPKQFARILVEEIIDKGENDPSPFLKRNGINPRNLQDKDEIWKMFVMYNLYTGNIKDATVEKYWNMIPAGSIVKSRQKLLDKIASLKGKPCYTNFSTNCPMTFTKTGGYKNIHCNDHSSLRTCPVVNIVEELTWHRQHYKTAKVITECAKRLLIENKHGNISGNLNEIVNNLVKKHESSGNDYKARITEEFLSYFCNIRNYSECPKAIVWLLADLSSPVHRLDHWPYFDLSECTPVDTHVQRLVERFGFLPSGQVSEKVIGQRLAEFFPEEPRKLNLALYKLGAEQQLDICRSTPNCGRCYSELPKVYEACPYKAN